MADLTDLCARAVAAAESGELVECYAQESRQVDVRVRAGEVESLSFAETRGVGVRVIVDGRLGYAYAADPGREEVVDLVRSARENAAFAEPDAGNVLPPFELAEPIDGLFDDEQAASGIEGKVAAALELERLTTSVRPEVRQVESVSYGDAVSRVAIGSTADGTRAREYARTDCWMSSNCLAEREAETQTGWSFDLAHARGELRMTQVAEEAATRAARLLGGTKPPTERLPVVLDPLAAASFLSVLAGALSAESVQKGRSPLAGLVEEAIGSLSVTLVDDGRRRDGPSAAPFDDEGVPTGRTPLVEAGVLRGFLHNAYTAARASARSTGNARRGSYRSAPGVAPSNLYLEPGALGVDDLLVRAGRAVYVQDVTGLHSGANAISGTFSVGATGLRVEGGAIGEPLREMTIASSLLDILKAVATVASDLRFYPFGGGLGSPTVLIGEMMVGGV